MKSIKESPSGVIGFRNHRGEHVTPAPVHATVAKNTFGRLLDTAMRGGAVVITKHDSPRAVLLSVEDYTALLQAREQTLNTLSAEFDALLAHMQKPGMDRRMQAAFSATPAQLSRAAVAAARKRG